MINATLTLEMDKAPDAVPEVTSGEVVVDNSTNNDSSNRTTVLWTMESVGSAIRTMTYTLDYCDCDYL